VEYQAPELTMKPEDKTPEDIEREMLQTRESITEKVTALENQVIGTAQSVTTAVSDTVEAVKSLVSSAPGAVSDTVKQSLASVRDALDVTGCVRRNPWTSVGTSAAAGFLLGYLLGGRRESAPVAVANVPAYTPPAPPQPKEPGFFDELLSQVAGEVKRLAKEAVASTSAALKDNISTEMPKLVDSAVSRVKPDPVGV
jgi:ElaB/YqjD/DUF883 family membrane-anchored ribosome-binding protein